MKADSFGPSGRALSEQDFRGGSALSAVGELPRSEWELHERMPRMDDVREFEVWMRNDTVRRVRRIGNRSRLISPGALVYTDCTYNAQNIFCDEADVIGWRHSGRLAPPMPEPPRAPLLASLFGYDAAAHAAAYPGF